MAIRNLSEKPVQPMEQLIFDALDAWENLLQEVCGHVGIIHPYVLNTLQKQHIDVQYVWGI